MRLMKTCQRYIGILLILPVMQSCSKDEASTMREPYGNDLLKTTENLTEKSQIKQKTVFTCELNFQFFDDDIGNSTCPSTEFATVLLNYFEDFFQDPNFDFSLANYYRDLNMKYVTHYRGDNYFGENGEYTKLAEKRIRELTRFWDLNREIVVNAEHTFFLDDREILADMIESFDRTVRNRTEAYEKADLLIAKNALSPNLPESPFFALDGFTKDNGLLVIGDGLIESLVKTGVDEKVAFTAVLAHEWWHQAQFKYNWIEINEFDKPWERSRFIELESDFAAAYFLTHKRGATYNWKRIEDYFEISFSVGDCLPSSEDHHGTPGERLAAAKLGFTLANSAQKKGGILSPEEVHEYFLANLDFIL